MFKNFKDMKFKIVSFGLLLSTSLFSFVGLSSLFYLKLHSDRVEHSKYINDRAETIITEAVTSIYDLNYLQFSTCSDENLYEMRKQVFKSRYIKSIAFHKENNATCFTETGRLKESVSYGAPEFITKGSFSVWSNLNLVALDDPAANIIKKQNYSVILDIRQTRDIEFENFEWQLTYKHDEVIGKIAGTTGLYLQDMKTRSMLDLYHTRCTNDEFQICSTTYIPLENIYPQYSILINCLITVWVALAIALYIFLGFKLKSYHSFRYRISRGLKDDNFFPVFQPIVDLQTGKVIGCEMLARFRDSKGDIYPDDFIPIISDLGVTWKFTDSMLKKALDCLEEYDDHFPMGFRFSFNVFPSDIMSNAVRNILFNKRLLESKYKLVLEITENEFLEEETAQMHLAQLSRIGIAVAIDDFGTGYSNLMQLKKINSELLKIDRSFVFDLEEGAIKANLITHIVNIANDANMEIIAEGVENIRQHKILKKMKVEYGQGWVFGKPMAIKDLIRLLD